MENQSGTLVGKIGPTRPVNWSVILVFVVVEALFLAVLNLVLFPSGWFRPLNQATGGLINATLQGSLLNLALVVGLIFFGLAKLSPRELGLFARQIPAAIGVTAGVWLLMQVLLALIGLASTGTIAVNPQWARYGFTPIFGLLLGQVFGNSLFEEIAFRGFLLPQLFLKAGGHSTRVRLAIAIVVALVIFTLMHLPNQIMAVLYENAPVEDIGINFLIIAGWTLLLTSIYVVTGNLFIAVGIHALIDAPTSVAAPVFVPQLVMLVVVLAVFAIRRLLKRRAFPSGASTMQADRAAG